MQHSGVLIKTAGSTARRKGHRLRAWLEQLISTSVGTLQHLRNPRGHIRAQCSAALCSMQHGSRCWEGCRFWVLEDMQDATWQHLLSQQASPVHILFVQSDIAGAALHPQSVRGCSLLQGVGL